MERLDDLTVAELEATLDEATGKRETQRLIAAIIYKRGPSVPMIAEWIGVRAATVYQWFDRIEDEPIERAVQDRKRPGRPLKLADADRAQFREAIRRPPVEAGYDRPEWTPALAQRFLEDEFDVQYSRRHAQRLLNDADHTG